MNEFTLDNYLEVQRDNIGVKALTLCVTDLALILYTSHSEEILEKFLRKL